MIPGIQTASASISTASPVPDHRISTRTATVEGRAVTFSITTFGDGRSENILFPENGIHLTQDPVDATGFEIACRQLSEEQLCAVRRWTMTDAERHERFSDGQLNLNRRGIEGINYDLNAALAANTPLDQEQGETCTHLSSALNQLPKASGEYLRIAVYPDSNDMPWVSRIRVGDRVTNFPCFMSVSETDNYAREILGTQGALEPDEGYREGIVIYQIENATTAVPLLRGPLSLTHEQEVLFPRGACFEVKSISLALPNVEGMPVRAGVFLSEVPNTHQPVRNLYSGESVQITAL